MVIGFNPQFISSILEGSKIHTIREDKNNRWQQGKVMHMATGVRTKKYKCFSVKKCTGIRAISINPLDKEVHIFYNDTQSTTFNEKGIESLAKNDGFASVDDFWKWFDKPFKGKLIYWTEYKY